MSNDLPLCHSMPCFTRSVQTSPALLDSIDSASTGVSVAFGPRRSNSFSKMIVAPVLSAWVFGDAAANYDEPIMAERRQRKPVASVSVIDVLDHLQTVGFSLYEARLYVGLLQGGAQNGNELSKTAGVPSSKV